MAGARPRRLGLVLVFGLLLAVAAGGVIFGPQLAPALFARDGRLARTRQKFSKLRAFALFRAPGDRAVLRGQPPAPRATKHAAPAH